MPESTSQQRENWKHFKCHPERMVVVDFGPDRIRVARTTEEAWQALAKVFRAHRYPIRNRTPTATIVVRSKAAADRAFILTASLWT